MILQVTGLARHFGGVRAVDGVDLSVTEGDFYGLIGPNGSGKTTLVDLISGFQEPDAGRIELGQQVVTGLPPHRLAALGVARTFQRVRLFGGLSVADNVLVGMHTRSAGGGPGRLLGLPGARAAHRAQVDQATGLLGRVGLSGLEDRMAGTLAYGQQRRLEIARALASGPRLLLADEPVAGMNPSEIARLAELFTELNAEGLTIILVEHHLKLVVQVCNRLAVLDYGKLIADGPPAAVLEQPAVAEAYLGKAGAAQVKADEASP